MTKRSDFEDYRSLLQGIAYRMLGSVAEAEDIVQETYLKWKTQDPDCIQNMRSWLVTACSRLSVDRLKSAQHQRTTYIGPWLPEPWLVQEESPADELVTDDTVSTALLYALERLTPSERAAFLLHDVFGYNFDEISNILQKSSAACRKLASRARARANENRPRFEADPHTHQKLIDSFFGAIKEGDLKPLEALLAEDATLVSDGGGKAIAARKVLLGSEIIAKFFINIAKSAKRSSIRYEQRPAWYSGGPGLLILENGQPVSAINIVVANERIQSFFIIRNPDKLSKFRSN